MKQFLTKYIIWSLLMLKMRLWHCTYMKQIRGINPGIQSTACVNIRWHFNCRFNTAAAVGATVQARTYPALCNRNDCSKIPVDAAAAMWCVNPLKIYPDLSPLFIIWLNSAVNLRRLSGQMKTLNMHEVDSYFYLPVSTVLMQYFSMIR